MEIYAWEPSFNSISTIISRDEQRNANSQYCQCKTFSYGQSINAKYEANNLGYDEALLMNNHGELCCGTNANLLIKRKNQWITPHIKSGCLAGVMRQQGLNSGLIQEAKITDELYEGDEWLLINSLSCKPINKVNKNSLTISTNPQELWFSLLAIKD